MITMNVAFARMKRQKIEKFSERNYIPASDIVDKIPVLAEYSEQQFLFAIYDNPERWTAFSVNYVFSVCEGQFSILQMDTEMELIYKYFTIEDNDFASHVYLKDGRKIWMKSDDLCSLVVNVMLMLQHVPCGTRIPVSRLVEHEQKSGGS